MIRRSCRLGIDTVLRMTSVQPATRLLALLLAVVASACWTGADLTSFPVVEVRAHRPAETRGCAALVYLLGDPPPEPDELAECAAADAEAVAWCGQVVWWRHSRDLRDWITSAIAWCSWQSEEGG